MITPHHDEDLDPDEDPGNGGNGEQNPEPVTPVTGTDPADDPDDELDPDDDDDEKGTQIVSTLRKEAGDYRRKLRDTETERDELRHELYRERVAALGVLADPDDLPYDEDALTDPARLRELADELVTAKPHLRSRRIRQRAGQGEGSEGDGFSLAGALARGA